MSERPLPVITDTNKSFWEGCRKHEFLLQKCKDCGHLQFYPRTICTECMSTKLGWVKASGNGSVYTFSTVYQAPLAGLASEIPYTFTIVELEEGVRVTAWIVECEPEKIKVGMPVKVCFKDLTEQISLPCFRPR